MDTIQSLASWKLGEEAGHSLIDDVLRMRTKGILDDSQTLEMISSILEIYKGRVRRDAGEGIITTTPRKLNGFGVASDLLDESFSKKSAGKQ